MNVANLENCKRLYELSGWGEDCEFHWLHREIFDRIPRQSDLKDGVTEEDYAPAYSAGYLLRKLPAQFGKRGSNSAECLRLAKGKNKYLAGYIGVDLVWGFPCEADTPEDALCLLAIKLFEEGVLK